MKVLILLGICLTSALAITYKDVINEEWETFKLEHKKSYTDPVEETFRKKIFMENRQKIARHNRRFFNGIKSYSMAMNSFGDMLHDEFVSTMNGYQPNYRNRANVTATTYLSPAHVSVPDQVDWRKEGYVTPVKNQGQCGSCWSFSSTGALEGQHFRKAGKLVSLSEQNLIDCSSKYGNEGCNGGMMDFAFEYVKDNKGIDTEKSYPYEAASDKCRYNPKSKGATDTGFVDVEPSGSEDKLKEAVGTVGPVSVAIDASQESFQFYSEGVYDEPECSSTNLDHAVLVVGYGSALQGGSFWIVKNSWGPTWGDEGYIRMSRDKENQCGIATSPSYPLV